MAVKLQLKDLDLGTIVTDKTNSTKYIILEQKYKITSEKTSDGILLGFYSNNDIRYFTNQIFDADTVGKRYNESDIKELLNSTPLPEQLKVSERLAECIIPTMIAGDDNAYGLIGPMKLFLPSLIEFGISFRDLGTDNTEVDILGVAIDTTKSEKIKSYISALKIAKILMRNTSDFDVYLSDATTVPMETPSNMCYFLCVDPTLYVGLDEEDNYCLFDNFINSKNELNKAIQAAETLIARYESIPEFKAYTDALKELINESKNISDTEYQSVIDQATRNILDATSELEAKIAEYNLEQSRITQNVNSIQELIDKIEEFLRILGVNEYITMASIQEYINGLYVLKEELSNKKDNLLNKAEPPMNAIDLNDFLNEKYTEYFNLENNINREIFSNSSSTELKAELGDLINKCTILMKDYPLIDRTNLGAATEDAKKIFFSDSATNEMIQQAILNLSQREQEFRNSMKFEIDNPAPVLEIGSFGRRRTENVTLTNNISEDVNVVSSNESVIAVNTIPTILPDVLPLGMEKQYTLTGISEGIATVTFTPVSSSTRSIGDSITVSATVNRRDTFDPSYLDLIEDRAKVSIQQIDSGINGLPHLGTRLELIEQKLFNSSSTLDSGLLNVLNTTTPFPVINNIEAFLIKDADVTAGLSTTITLSNSYYVGKHHLMVYRNGVYQQLGVRYKERTNKTVEFSANYLLPGDRLLFISGSSGLENLTNVGVEYTESGLLKKIKFYQNTEVFREIEYIYDEKPQIIQQIISDELFKFIKTFTYTNDLVSDITIEVVKKETEDNGS